jgi:asparagine synthase (glutamine-hydrolysing)
VTAESTWTVDDVAASENTSWLLDVALDALADGDEVCRGPFERHGGLNTFFDGILHDRDDWLRSLGLPRSTTNAGVLAAGFAKRGPAFLTTLRGSFVAAVVDRAAGTALVMRDPLGATPLYYTTLGRRAFFAADSQILLGQPGVSRDLNRTALADRLCARWPAAGETYFAAIRRVPAGSVARVNGAGVTVARYWDPAPGGEPVRWLTSIESFESTFERAVRRCTAGGGVGVFLSGGLDSISIAAVATDLASRARQPSPVALSLGFPDPGCDERQLQTSVAHQLGVTHCLLDFETALGGEGLLPQTLRLNATLASPVLNTWAPAYFALARLGRRAGVRTILTGSGGDEWLTVSPFYAADLMGRGDVAGLIRLAGVWQRSYRQTRSSTARILFWRYGLRPLLSRLLFRMAPETWSARRARRVTRQDPEWVAPDPGLRAAQHHHAPASLSPADPPQGFYLQDVRSGLDHAIVSLEMEEQAHFGRQLGVRFMHPYWDADLVELLYRLPPSLLMASGRAKALVRTMLAERFPNLGFERHRKVVATAFLRRLLLHESPAVLDQLHRFRALHGLGVVDGPRAEAFARRSLSDPSGDGLYRAWELLNVESWAQLHTA